MHSWKNIHLLMGRSAARCRVTGRGYMDVNRISGYIPGKMVFFLMQVTSTPSSPVYGLCICGLGFGVMYAKSHVPLKGLYGTHNVAYRSTQGRYFRQSSMCRCANQGLPDCGRSG